MKSVLGHSHLPWVFTWPSRIALARASVFSASVALLVFRSTFAYSSSALAKFAGSAPWGAFSKIEMACLQQDSASASFPCAAGVGHLRAAACHVRVVRAECCLVRQECTLEQRLGLGELPLLRVEPTERLEARRHVRMVGTEGFLADEERRLRSGSASAYLSSSR